MNPKRRMRSVLVWLLLLTLGSAAAGGAAQTKTHHLKRKDVLRRDSPLEALQFRRLRMQDQNGNIAADGWEKAREHMVRMRDVQLERARAGAATRQPTTKPEAAGIRPDSWTWLGPGNIGGRIRSIVISPTDPESMWVGSVSGGIWHTTNAGASWFPVNGFLANLAVSTMVIDPVFPNNMYAGTGESFAGIGGNAFDGAIGLQGAGVLKSTDGGATWNQLASTNNPNWYYVNRLAHAPATGTILAATYTGLWRSTDGGASWTQAVVPPNPLAGSPIATLDVAVARFDASRAIAGEFGRALYSVDGGVTFTPSTFTPPIGTNQSCAQMPLAGSLRVEIAYAPSDATMVYAAVDQNQGDIYRSTDGGQTFSLVNTCLTYLGGQGGYGNSIWVSPADPNFLVVGGISLYRSTNGGATFTMISNSPPVSAHSDHHIIVAHPNFNNAGNRTVFFGNDGGIWKTDDVSAASVTGGWTALNHFLGITQFYGAAGNPTSGVIIGGTQDNGTPRSTGGTESWTQSISFGAGDGGFCAADPTDPHYLYGEHLFPSLRIERSADGGQTGTIISGGIPDIAKTYPLAPIVLDANDPQANTMVAGAVQLWRSTNVKAATPTWTSIKPAATYGITAVAVANGNANVICVGHGNGDIYLTTNGLSANPTWTKIFSPLSNHFVTRLVIDTSRTPYWIYAAFGGFVGNNVMRTIDLGANWKDITGVGATGLPDVPVYSMVIHPVFPDLLYVGTEVGVFTSEDAGATWELPQDGPVNVSIDDLFWMAGDLVAATFGRSMYRASGGIYVDGSNTGLQLGTSDHPFKTVAAGVNAVTTYAPIWIRPGHYNEPMTIGPMNHALELRSTGGTVTIGTP